MQDFFSSNISFSYATVAVLLYTIFSRLALPTHFYTMCNAQFTLWEDPTFCSFIFQADKLG